MMLHPKYEAFCRSFQREGNATDAARDAGYSYENAAGQGYRLLKREDIQARLAELQAQDDADDARFLAERLERRARLDAMVATEAAKLLAKLDPIYEDRLESGDHANAMKVIELQARIAGLLISDDATASRGAAKARRGAAGNGRDLG